MLISIAVIVFLGRTLLLMSPDQLQNGEYKSGQRQQRDEKEYNAMTTPH